MRHVAPIVLLLLQPVYATRRVWRYQRGNQNPYIGEQTTQWPKEKVQKDKQRSTKHTYKTKDRVIRTPLKIGGEVRYSGRVCFVISYIACVILDDCSVGLETGLCFKSLRLT